jgi:hypothetical protein
MKKEAEYGILGYVLWDRRPPSERLRNYSLTPQNITKLAKRFSPIAKQRDVDDEGVTILYVPTAEGKFGVFLGLKILSSKGSKIHMYQFDQDEVEFAKIVLLPEDDK